MASSCTWQTEETCYTLVTNKKDFIAAAAECDLVHDGKLVEIESQEEQDFLKNSLIEYYGYGVSCGEDYHYRETTAVDLIWLWTGGVYRYANIDRYHQEYRWTWNESN